MKKKIGEIYNKPIVIGDKNLVTKNEIHESALIGSSSSNEEAFEYLDVRSLDDVTKLILVSGALAFNGSMTMGDNVVKMVSPFGSFGIMGTTIDLSELKFIAIDFGFKIVSTDRIQSIKDIFIEQYNYTEEELAAIPRITKEEFYDLNSGDNSGESTVKEGDLIYYALNDSFTSIGNITDNITQIAVSRGESMSSGSVGNLNRFVDIQEVTINKGDDYVSISIPNFIVIDMPAFVYKVGSDLKTAEDIIGNSSVTRITKEEYDNIFNM